LNDNLQLSPLRKVLLDPASSIELTALEWDVLLCMTDKSRLTASLGNRLERQGMTGELPEEVKTRFLAAQIYSRYRSRLIRWEMNRLQRALRGTNYEVVALKGGAYLLLNLPFAESRLAADLDILVPASDISEFERLLQEQGWEPEELSEYDQRYYREWMHEIPPLRHRERKVEVDVHHALLPLTAKLKPNSDLLFESARPIEGSRFKVLCWKDMILHAVVHLFYDSDLDGRIRDLVDLDELFRRFCGSDRDAWAQLMERSKIQGLQRPLFYALRYCKQIVATPIPNDIQFDDKPSRLAIVIMDRLVPRAIFPDLPGKKNRINSIARWLLYVRSHYLRMPLRLLIPHLLYKSIKGQSH